MDNGIFAQCCYFRACILLCSDPILNLLTQEQFEVGNYSKKSSIWSCRSINQQDIVRFLLHLGKKKKTVYKARMSVCYPCSVKGIKENDLEGIAVSFITINTQDSRKFR